MADIRRAGDKVRLLVIPGSQNGSLRLDISFRAIIPEPGEKTVADYRASGHSSCRAVRHRPVIPAEIWDKSHVAHAVIFINNICLAIENYLNFSVKRCGRVACFVGEGKVDPTKHGACRIYSG